MRIAQLCSLQSLTGKYRGLQGNPCNKNRDPAMRTGFGFTVFLKRTDFNWNSIIGFFHRSIQFACFSGIYYCCSLVVVDYVIISGHCTAAVPIKHTREQRNENHFTVPNDPAEMTRTLYHTTMFWRRFCRSILRCQELKIILYFFSYFELFLLCFWHGKLCFCIQGVPH